MYTPEPKNIIVIGGNAAGPAAAAKAKRTDPDANVILFESGQFISTGTCELPYVLSGEIEHYEDIVFFTAESFSNEKGVKVYINHQAISINKNAKIIEIKDLSNDEVKSYEYDKLILATGSKAKCIEEIPSELDNVFTLKSVSDLNKIQSFIKDNEVKNAAVFGAGYIGLELTEALKKLDLSVSIFDINELPLNGAEPEISGLVKDILQLNDVHFYQNTRNLKYFFENNRLKKIKVDGYLKEFDILFVTAGVEPNVDLAIKAGLEIGRFGGIKIDNRCKTSNHHIYAAGDCVEVKNQLTKKTDYIPIATLAKRQGHTAGANASGGYAKFNPVVENIAVKIFDKTYSSVGLSEAEALNSFNRVDSVSAVLPNLVEVMPESKSVFGKIVYDDYTKLILGASFLGNHEVIGYADLISSMIYNKNEIGSLAEIDYNYTPPRSPFINILSVLGRKIRRG